MEEKAKKIIIKVLICLLVLGTLVGLYFLSTNVLFIKDNKKFSKEYPSVVEENIFVYKSSDEIIEMLESGTGVIYLGFPECKWCQAYVPILNKVAQEQKIKEIAYYNIKEDRSNNTEVYQRIVGLLKDFLEVDENDNPRIYVPEIVVVVEGIVTGHNNETSMIVDEELIPEDYWTKDATETLEENLKGITSILKNRIESNN